MHPRCAILAALILASWGGACAAADDYVTAGSCPGQEPTPVTFKIDCSKLKDPAAKALCKPFIENQACKLFPAYRKITGIKLEDRCRMINYTIYDRDNWPHSGAGGMSFNCQIDYMAQYAFQNRPKALGPYDEHEILHHYRMSHKVLDRLTAAHPLFESSMLEAEREIGMPPTMPMA
jgi:hypothetical protein